MDVCLISSRVGACKSFKRQFIPELCKLYPGGYGGISWTRIKSMHLTQVIRQEQAKTERGEPNAWTPVVNRFP